MEGPTLEGPTLEGPAMEGPTFRSARQARSVRLKADTPAATQNSKLRTDNY
jgi:hypothetical protein